MKKLKKRIIISDNMEWKSCRIVDGKLKWVIVDDNEKVINKDPRKEELKLLSVLIEKDGRSDPKNKKYTDNELLNYLRQFYEENGRIPVASDFTNNPEYPNAGTYQKRFGSWNKALKLVGLDIDSIVKQGIVKTNGQKARLSEMTVRDHFKNHPIDLAGENRISPCDGICPNGKTYDVKSSKLREHEGQLYWKFGTNNKYKEEIEIFYFLAFNQDYTKLEYGWRVPGEVVESNNFYIGKSKVEKMKEYDITYKLKEVFRRQ